MKILANKQKQALRIVNNEFTGIRKMTGRMKVLWEIQHKYSTRFSKKSFVENQLVYNQTNVSVLLRGPRINNKNPLTTKLSLKIQ